MKSRKLSFTLGLVVALAIFNAAACDCLFAAAAETQAVKEAAPICHHEGAEAEKAATKDCCVEFKAEQGVLFKSQLGTGQSLFQKSVQLLSTIAAYMAPPSPLFCSGTHKDTGPESRSPDTPIRIKHQSFLI